MTVLFAALFIAASLAFIGFLFVPTPVAAVCRRELYTLVNGPIGLVSLAAFLIISQTLYAAVIFKYGEASMRPFFEQAPLVFSLIAPLVAMRMWAEERRTQTIELLLTLPARTWEAVFGKFLAGWAFLAVCLLATFSTPLMLQFALTEPAKPGIAHIKSATEPGRSGLPSLSSSGARPSSSPSGATAASQPALRESPPATGPEWGPIWGGYAGCLLLAAFALAIGSFTSSVTRDQIVAAILGIIICLALWSLGQQLVINTLNGLRDGAGTFLSMLSHQQRFLNLAKGLWDWSDVLFFVSGTSVFLWMTSVSVEKQRS
jgi:ABC-2 type transport system permease protein